MRRVRGMAGLVVLALAGSAAAAPSPGGTYKVREGDTLSRVAKKTGVPVDALAKANSIADPDRVRAGQVLTIPKVGEPAPVAAAAAEPLPSPVVVVGGGRTHQVAAGQNLAGIARLYDTTVAELVKANTLKNPNLIRIGTDLVVPGPPWLCPVQGAHQFTDSWGQPRDGGRRHLGVDIFAARGTPVVANVGGITRHSVGAVAGNSYYLDGDDGNTYYGAHLDTLAPPGRVERGAVLGTVGTTGNAKGSTPHLHFELKPGGGPSVNPYPTVHQWC
ncbi:MAG: LysM peptidoglycan-binding domain-containing protein [Acidimicrobiales bacterium]